MQANNRQQQAMSSLRNKLLVIQGIDEIRDDIFSSMTLDWILNAAPNEPGIETALQMKDLVEGDHPEFQLGNQQAQELLDAWLQFVAEYYAVNGGRRRRSKKTRKHKKRSKKTRRV